DAMLAEGVYVIAFSYPVVPKGKARIRVQISAALTTSELDTAIAAFTKVGKQLSVI
ncbi:MAG: aminotransferase class I/II-fold pyridoxal phosphate-dependent enzyme, partial [Deltaproteobacteria bacterium]|nr:aminotransferase class I/II-fold pyridoxal phosphate-dependent enzyme [Deltaproteobacteria bacterium]